MSSANSAIIVAKLLDTEGFTEHTANVVDRFARRQMGKREQERHDKTERAMGNVCENLDDATKLVIGAFVTLHKKMSFETGVRIGLTAMATKDAKDYPKDDFPRDSIWGVPARKNQDYCVEVLYPEDDGESYEWIEVLPKFSDRAEAKLEAVRIAKKSGVSSRVSQAGHIVQRYTKKGTKLGGD